MIRDCNLSVLPDEPPAPEVVPVHLLDCPKDGFDYAALVVLCHEPVKVVPVGPGHLAPGPWLPPFLQVVLDLGRMRGVMPMPAIASHISLAR